jgi:hypothetical protein
LSPRSPRARVDDKTQVPVPPAITSGSWVSRTEMPSSGIAGASTPCLANEAARRSPPMPRRLAGTLCDLPSTPSLNLNAAIVRTTIRDLGCAPPLQIQGSMQITGSSRGDARQAKIAQLFQRFERKANVRYLTLIGHGRTASDRPASDYKHGQECDRRRRATLLHGSAGWRRKLGGVGRRPLP